MRWRVGYAAVGLIVVGCSASSHVTVDAKRPAPTTPASRPGGLIGVIDTARLTAVCADARQAETVVQGGEASAATASLLAAATLLERPPVDPAAAAAAASIRADVTAGHSERALATALAFCRTHGG